MVIPSHITSPAGVSYERPPPFIMTVFHNDTPYFEIVSQRYREFTECGERKTRRKSIVTGVSDSIMYRTQRQKIASQEKTEIPQKSV